MISVTIGTVTKTAEEALTGGWLFEQIERRRRAGVVASVEIKIEIGHDIDIYLVAPPRPGPGYGRPPRPAERRILDLWSGLGLGDQNYEVDDLAAFLRRLTRLAA